MEERKMKKIVALVLAMVMCMTCLAGCGGATGNGGGSNNGKIWNLSEAEVAKDIVLQANIRESYHRKLYAHVNSNLMNGITADTSAASAQPVWVTILEILMGAGYVGFMVMLILYVLAERKERRA